MDFLDIAMGFASKSAHDLSGGRMFESLILLAIIWRKLKPHLTKIEERLQGLESAVSEGFKAGESRFQQVESRLKKVEEQQQEIHHG